ncbi:MAG: hypothetical protein EOO40_09390, partial [Deltaproteobacteria bacterium]
TGLYVRALRDDLPKLPAVPASLRQALMQDWQRSAAACLARLTTLDPQAAAHIDRHNPRRVLRALEICLLSGTSATAVWAEAARLRRPWPLHLVVLDREDADLRARLAARCAAMLRQGLLEEVVGLLQRGVSPDCRPMRALGYRQCNEMLQGRLPRPQLEAAIVQASWQYVRRQRTWWRHVGVDSWLVGDPPSTQISALLRRLAATSH